MSLSEQKQALRSADSFFIWRSLRCGGVQRREGEREIVVVCVSVMNVLCNGTKLNFKPRVLEERHLAPPPALTSSLLQNRFIGALTLELGLNKVSQYSEKQGLFQSTCHLWSTFIACCQDRIWKLGGKSQHKQKPVHEGGGGMQQRIWASVFLPVR